MCLPKRLSSSVTLCLISLACNPSLRHFLPARGCERVSHCPFKELARRRRRLPVLCSQSLLSPPHSLTPLFNRRRGGHFLPLIIRITTPPCLLSALSHSYAREVRLTMERSFGEPTPFLCMAGKQPEVMTFESYLAMPALKY